MFRLQQVLYTHKEIGTDPLGQKNDMVSARYMMSLGTGSRSSAIVTGEETQDIMDLQKFTAPSTFKQITQGQLFYNSTANAFKETITDFPGGTWALVEMLKALWFCHLQFQQQLILVLLHGGNNTSGSPAKLWMQNNITARLGLK